MSSAADITRPGVETASRDRAGRFRARHYIDSYKALVIPITVGLIAAYDAWSNSLIWIYLGLHGTYTVCWLLKSHLFPDRRWEEYVSTGRGLYIFFGMSLYFLVPWLIVTGNAGTPEAWFVGLCVALTVFGVFWHFASDMQKTTNLELRPGVLITDGLWSVVRNPNYFGELLIYLGFTLLAFHWAPPLILLFILVTEWIPNMRRKDESLSRYPEFGDYERRTKLFIPYLW